LHQGVGETFLHRAVAPAEIFFLARAAALDAFGQLNQAFSSAALIGGIGAPERLLPIQHHVFDHVAQCLIQVVVHRQLAGVDDAHGEAFADGVIQKHRVDRLAHGVIAAEREADVRYAARHARMRQIAGDPAGRLDEVDRIMIVFFDAGGDRKHVGVEDDVLRREAHLIDQNAIGPFANFLAALEAVGLPLFVEGHDHRRRAVLAAQLGVLDKSGLAFLMEIEFTTALPWTQRRPCSMTSHLELSIMMGTREISGSEAIRFRKRRMQAAESNMASSMLMSMICAPFSTCCRATCSASSYFSSRISRKNILLPVTLVRSPTFTNSVSASILSGSRPDSRVLTGISGTVRGATPASFFT